MVEVDRARGRVIERRGTGEADAGGGQGRTAGLPLALVVFDDQQVVLDIPTRTVTGPAAGRRDGSRRRGVSVGARGILSGIDGVINLSTKFAPAERASTPGRQRRWGSAGRWRRCSDSWRPQGQAPATPEGRSVGERGVTEARAGAHGAGSGRFVIGTSGRLNNRRAREGRDARRF